MLCIQPPLSSLCSALRQLLCCLWWWLLGSEKHHFDQTTRRRNSDAFTDFSLSGKHEFLSYMIMSLYTLKGEEEEEERMKEDQQQQQLSMNDVVQELLKLQKEEDDKHNENKQSTKGDEEEGDEEDILDDGYDKSIDTPELVYDRLCTDFAILSSHQLELFITDLNESLCNLTNDIIRLAHKKQIQQRLKQQKDNNNNSDSEEDEEEDDQEEIIDSFKYPITNTLLSTISDNSLKYNSIVQNSNQNNNSNNPSTKDTQLSSCYSTLYYLYFIKLFKLSLLLKLNGISNLLNQYYLDDDIESDIESELEEVEEEEQVEDKIKEIKEEPTPTMTTTTTKDEEDDESNYQSFDTSPTNFIIDYDQFGQFNQQQQQSWKIVCKKLSNIYQTSFSYQHLSPNRVWEEYSMFDDLKDITTHLLTFSQDDEKQDLLFILPLFIYLIRDRTIDAPNEIPYNLPLIFNILCIEQNNESNDNNNNFNLSPFQFKSLVSLFSSFVDIRNMNDRSKTFLIQSIVDDCLDYFVHRLSMWSSLPDQQFANINSKDELEAVIITHTNQPLKLITKITIFVSNNSKKYNKIEWDKIYQSKGLISQYITLVTKIENIKQQKEKEEEKEKEKDDSLKLNSMEQIQDLSLMWLTRSSCQSNNISLFIEKVPQLQHIIVIKDLSLYSNNEQQTTNFKFKYNIIWSILILLNNNNNNNNCIEIIFKIINNLLSTNNLENKNFNQISSLAIIIQLLLLIKQSKEVDQTRLIFDDLLVQKILKGIDSKLTSTISQLQQSLQKSTSTDNNNNLEKRERKFIADAPFFLLINLSLPNKQTNIVLEKRRMVDKSLALFVTANIIPPSVMLAILPSLQLQSIIIQNAIFSLCAGIMAYRLIPSIAYLTSEAGLTGMDLNKKGDPKFSGKKIPESLGIATSVVYLLCVILFQLFQWFSFPEAIQLSEYNAALTSICFMILLGFGDDVLNLRWRYKLVLPMFASLPLLVAYAGGTSVVVPHVTFPVDLRFYLGNTFDLGIFYRIYLLMLAIFCTNSINILAGINGLEVGQSIVISTAIIVHNLVELRLHHQALVAGTALTLASPHLLSLVLMVPFFFTTVALLIFNWYPSRVFVGDTFTYFADSQLSLLASTALWSHPLSPSSCASFQPGHRQHGGHPYQPHHYQSHAAHSRSND
ncbi:hypothetical protein DFA_02434 [Cavenderia fasciculata]|uniref:UDP-N-acetylglucosamine--dolichyl-phosphate N-acetylglucosaminephosphotransferase n=1 Tax=Cavenderia fasciculata TaxID=261658 RepID=F4PZF7_CACFS|nr:uncharacterized protein DFA_02434 [Cavenderia fasciculata]EGG19186.1 hypothetical protein DFA_02434 [Cavenderia fasciculata]|eukprot:XP_004366819.1 hypothetical protein DFA_02434 [Cavenderia fasciculata]